MVSSHTIIRCRGETTFSFLNLREFFFVPINPAQFEDLVSGRSRGLKASSIRIGLRGLSWFYRLGVGFRNRSFNRNPDRTHQASVPVISIGNITTGGTGKTPMVEWVCRYIRSKGKRVAILSRGYGAERDSVNDEALQLEHLLPDVPHLQDPNRSQIADIAVKELESEVLVLDDGFQHRKLRRDLDVVLIDATNPFGYGCLLPRGLLREPLSGLKRASLIVLTRIDQVDSEQLDSIRNRIRKYARRQPIVSTIHRPASLRNHSGDITPIETNSGKNNSFQNLKTAAFCGIGNPHSFRRTLEQLDVKLVDFRSFPDHCRYDKETMGELTEWLKSIPAEERPEQLLCTHKDLVKIRTNSLLGIPLRAVCIELEILEGEFELQTLLDFVSNGNQFDNPEES